MFRSVVQLAVAFVALTCWDHSPARANDAVPAAAAGVSETPKPPQMLVMNNGDLIEGSITLSQAGYELTQPSGGRIVLPTPFVWFTAQTRVEAYETLAKRYPDKSANGHVSLARWCTKHGLKDAAEEELRIALTIDPQHREARNSLRLVADLSNPVPSFANAASGEFDSNSTLGGLPPNLALDFTKVQAIFVNGCGNASCHGTASQSAFTIQNARSGNPAFKSLTQRNLEAIRGRISVEDPLHSLIFTAPQTTGHGGSRRPIVGQAQLRFIQKWAVAVARTSPAAASGKPNKPSPITLTSSIKTVFADNVDPDAAPQDEPRRLEPPAKANAVVDVLRGAIAEERADAFDPNDFNRRFGPNAGRPSLPVSEGPQ